MASSGNFAALTNLTASTTNTFSFGNCRITSSSGGWGAPLTLAANTGKFYVEVYFAVSDANGGRISVLPTNSGKYNQGQQSASTSGDYAVEWKYDGDGNFIANNGSSSQSSVGSWAQGDVAAVAIDLDASPKTVQFYKNNSTIGTAENINTSAVGPFTVMIYAHNAGTWHINAGQDSTFGGALSAGGNADGNGFGDFKYSPPSGFNALCSANLPVDDNIDPGGDNGETQNPQKVCGVVSYSGTGSSQSITGLGFQPDFVWAKAHSASQSHRLYDSSRGVSTGNMLFSDTTGTAQSGTDLLTSFDNDGFTYGTSGSNANDSGKDYVAWCWKANGGTTSTNTSGTSNSTVQANQAAGFSIVEYAGTLTSSGVVTIGHGLSAAPEWIMIKQKNKTGRWYCWHAGSSGANYMLELNDTTGEQDKSSNGNMSLPTSTVFYTNYTEGSNESTRNHIAYCWHGVEGYSKFGKYTPGNNNTDGPFVYTGFRPQIVIVKGLVSGAAWIIKDDTFDGDGVNNDTGVLQPNAAAGKYTTAGGVLDFLSNGFKVRTDNAVANSTSYDPYVYMAWGAVPFKYNNAF